MTIKLVVTILVWTKMGAVTQDQLVNGVMDNALRSSLLLVYRVHLQLVVDFVPSSLIH